MSKFATTVILILATFFTDTRCIKNNAEIQRDILDHILPKNPNEILVPPGNGTSGPTEVKIFMHIKSIDGLNDEKMELTTKFIFRQIWKDPRLRYDITNTEIKRILINDAKLIWTPDIYFTTLVKGNSYDVIRPTTYLRIYPDGTVLYSKCVSLTVSCPMNLKRFPFDNQACDLPISTYGSTTEDVILMWRTDTYPVTLSKNVMPPLFTLEKFWTHHRIIYVTTGNYTNLELSFLFKRELMPHIYHVFLPCTMMVILSWIPFWINPKQLTVRLMLGLSVLISSTLLVYDYNASRPKTSYSTSMDCFTGACLTFMFFAVIQSTVVHILDEKGNTDAKPLVENGELKNLKRSKRWFRKVSQATDKINFWTRIIVPLAYMSYCLVYFGFGIAG